MPIPGPYTLWAAWVRATSGLGKKDTHRVLEERVQDVPVLPGVIWGGQ